MTPSLRRILSGTVATLYFASQVVLGSAAETNIWAERSHSKSQTSSVRRSIQLASLPTSFSPKTNPENILQQLPLLSNPLSTNSAWKPTHSKGWDRYPKSLRAILKTIPLSHANIQDIYASAQPTQSPVLLIQDVHMNPEAQTNTVALLEELIEQHSIDSVGVEGSFDRFDFAPYRKYDDKELTKTVMNDLLNQCLLAAPSVAGIVSQRMPPPFVGVDDKKHYEENLDALYASRELKPALLQEWNQIQPSLTEEKKKIFSPRLLEFDALRTAYLRSRVGFGAYLKKLSAYQENPSLVVQQFLAAYEMESSLNSKLVELERRKVIHQLTNALDENEITELVAKSVAYRTGRLDFGAYYNGLLHLCQTKGIDLKRTPYFENYIRYALLADGIPAEKLFHEVDVIEKHAIENLAQSQQEIQLMHKSDFLSLVHKLANWSLTPKEWARYKELKTKVSQTEPDLLSNKSLKPFEDFYEEADIRSEKMVENLMALKEPGPKVLILGGFHSPQVAQKLQNKNISFIVVSPKITHLRSDEANSGGSASYLSVFAREKTPLDRLFAGEKLFISPQTVAITHTQTALVTHGILEAEHTGQPRTLDDDQGRRYQFEPGTQSGGKGLRVHKTRIRMIKRIPRTTPTTKPTSGGFMLWLANLLMPVITQINPKTTWLDYFLKIGPFIENTLALSIGAMFGLWIYQPRMNVYPVFLLSIVVGWSVFVLLHVPNFFLQRKESGAKKPS